MALRHVKSGTIIEIAMIVPGWIRFSHRLQFDLRTRGLLRRAQIVASWPPIYIGNESDKHWEEGEDLSLLEFKTVEYKRKGNAVATDEQLARIARVPLTIHGLARSWVPLLLS